MARNPEEPILQNMEQPNESAAGKQVTVRPCSDQRSEQICNRKKKCRTARQGKARQ